MRMARVGALAVMCAGLAACGGTVAKHGHVFTEEDLQQVKTGMSKDQVALALGTPDTKSTAGDDVYYYISTTTKRPMAFMKPKVTDRQVVAIYFDKSNSVQRIANYGLQDGKVIDFVTRQTPSYGGEEGLIRSLFRNIGRAQPTVPSPGGS
ncbi:MAG: outer membrane protein assembly factor BamE [Hyphomicrobiales bacterium]|nr:outer membrane protein assembly factor BamE [Hyphomicrobiales bacterium]